MHSLSRGSERYTDITAHCDCRLVGAVYGFSYLSLPQRGDEGGELAGLIHSGAQDGCLTPVTASESQPTETSDSQGQTLTSSLWTNKSCFPECYGSWGRTVWEKAGRKDGVSVITAADPRWPSYLQYTALASSASSWSGLGHTQSASCCSTKTHSGVCVAGTPSLQSAVGRAHRGKHPGTWVDATQLILKFSAHGHLPSCPAELCPLLGTVRHH